MQGKSSRVRYEELELQRSSPGFRSSTQAAAAGGYLEVDEMVTTTREVALWAACAVTLCMVLLAGPASAQLRPDFYDKSCPSLSSIVSKQVQAAIKKEARMAASLLRLHFHDCFVQGCDASILLDDDSRLPQGEKGAGPNVNSVRGYEVIDDIKAEIERQCPRVVSCADIVVLASFQAIRQTGGPLPSIPLGRRDSLTASFAGANNNLPGPSSSVPQLKQKFSAVGLRSVTDLVALSGAHTLGFTRCLFITSRLYTFNGQGGSDPTIESRFLASLKQTCPPNGDGNTLKNFDPSPAKFDNRYFQELLAFKGVLNSDEILFTQSSDTKGLVETYARNQTRFFQDFAASMIRMSALTGPAKNGEIRRNCRKPNSLSFEDLEPIIELVTDM